MNYQINRTKMNAQPRSFALVKNIGTLPVYPDFGLFKE